VRHQSTNPISQNTYTTTFQVPSTPLGDVQIEGTPDFCGKAALCFDEMGTPYNCDVDGSNNPSNEAQMTASGTIKVKCGTNVLTISIEGYTGEASVQ